MKLNNPPHRVRLTCSREQKEITRLTDKLRRTFDSLERTQAKIVRLLRRSGS